MFFLLLPVGLALLVIYGGLTVWRAWPSRRPHPGRRRRRPSASLASLPLVPAGLLRGEDRTWVVFTTAESRDGHRVAARLRAAEPASRVTEVDAASEPRLVEALGIPRLPAVVLANRYGQVEARLIGLAAIEEYTR